MHSIRMTFKVFLRRKREKKKAETEEYTELNSFSNINNSFFSKEKKKYIFK
jgi:hypothetical protein